MPKWSELSAAEQETAARRIRLEAASAGADDPVEHAAGVERMIAGHAYAWSK